MDYQKVCIVIDGDKVVDSGVHSLGALTPTPEGKVQLIVVYAMDGTIQQADLYGKGLLATVTENGTAMVFSHNEYRELAMGVNPASPMARALLALVESPAQCDELLSALNDIATDVNNYEYGLPLHDEGAKARMREALYQWAASFKE